MNTSRSPLADFLRDRRDSLKPERVGIRDTSRRRVPGLRRSEVAELAGISADYYLRLEQGRGHQPSEQVLAGLRRALLLDSHGDDYLHRVAELSAGRESPPLDDDVPPGVLELVTVHTDVPAYLTNATLDVIAANAPARLLAPGVLQPGSNLVASVFTQYPDPRSESDWRRTAENLVASLRYHADPRSPRLHAVVADLSAKDARFLPIWKRCDVRPQSSAWPLAHIEGHGWVSLRSECFAVSGTLGYTMTLFFAEPNTPGVAALRGLVERARLSPGRIGSDLPMPHPRAVGSVEAAAEVAGLNRR